MPTEAPRTLAAIVSIDIVGYSELAERDPTEAVAQGRHVRSQAQTAADFHGGRIFNTAGDATLIASTHENFLLEKENFLEKKELFEEITGNKLTLTVKQD